MEATECCAEMLHPNRAYWTESSDSIPTTDPSTMLRTSFDFQIRTRLTPHRSPLTEYSVGSR